MNNNTIDKLNRLRQKLHLLTQFEKQQHGQPMNTHCYPYTAKHEEDPQRSFEQIARDASERLGTNIRNYRRKELESLHPAYSRDSNMEFVKEMYRLIGFSYLRSQQKLASV